MEKQPLSSVEYRKQKADALRAKRAENNNKAWTYLDKIRTKEDYQEAERFY